MILKDVIDEDFVNFKKPSMFLIFPHCSFKCCIEAGRDVCQNRELANARSVSIDVLKLVERYLNNPITKAIVCGGLEPFDSFEDLEELISTLREHGCSDPVVIYTGYTEEEVAEKVAALVKFGNIIIKFGRYIPDGSDHYDEVLGVHLASSNQYAVEL